MRSYQTEKIITASLAGETKQTIALKVFLLVLGIATLITLNNMPAYKGNLNVSLGNLHATSSQGYWWTAEQTGSKDLTAQYWWEISRPTGKTGIQNPELKTNLSTEINRYWWINNLQTKGSAQPYWWKTA